MLHVCCTNSACHVICVLHACYTHLAAWSTHLAAHVACYVHVACLLHAHGMFAASCMVHHACYMYSAGMLCVCCMHVACILHMYAPRMLQAACMYAATHTAWCSMDVVMLQPHDVVCIASNCRQLEDVSLNTGEHDSGHRYL